jgi:hypothetical protein
VEHNFTKSNLCKRLPIRLVFGIAFHLGEIVFYLSEIGHQFALSVKVFQFCKIGIELLNLT